ncbi:class I SAM-dependent methyltransferase [Pseudonocardia xishanensis]|uniref:Class I SAM-dependent methyltransferase n=1 Tax=Pseudonocardia xishanensis TaxID=630995 RepID=A0ABP8S215_9PSEU
MSDADRLRWDARHAAVGPGTPLPPDGLRGRLDLLPAVGRALDLACGRGAVAVWLAQRGLVVDGVDVSGAALTSARTLARSASGTPPPASGTPPLASGTPSPASPTPGRGSETPGSEGERVGAGAVRWIQADLDAGMPVAGPYDLVVCQRFREPALYPALADVLAPGGLLVITVLSEVDDEPGPFRASPGELATAFPTLETLAHEERNGEATLIARAPR